MAVWTQAGAPWRPLGQVTSVVPAAWPGGAGPALTQVYLAWRKASRADARGRKVSGQRGG